MKYSRRRNRSRVAPISAGYTYAWGSIPRARIRPAKKHGDLARIDLVVLALGSVNGFHVQSVTEDEGNVVFGTEVGDPVPAAYPCRVNTHSTPTTRSDPAIELMLLSVESHRLPPFVGIVNAVLYRTSGGGGLNEYPIARWTLRAEEEKIFVSSIPP